MTDRSAFDRREFLRSAALSAGAVAVAGVRPLFAQAPGIDPKWKGQMGIELGSVRMGLQEDYETTLRRVAEIGYKEVEPVDNYNNMEPAAYRALLDKYGLKMRSTHFGATEGPDLEKQLEGFQAMGILYTSVSAGGGRGAAGGRRGGGAGPGGGGGRAAAAGGTTPAGPQLGVGRFGGRPGGAGPGFDPKPAPMTTEAAKMVASELNRRGAIVKKFGMKMLFHNHTNEFEQLAEGGRTQYDVVITETDPNLVAMQLDIGWASIAGQNVLEMFAKHPGRFEIWHVKDAIGIRTANPTWGPYERARNSYQCPIGVGEVDYRSIFAAAGTAGLKYYIVEQDNPAEWGDSMAAFRVSYANLTKILSS